MKNGAAFVALCLLAGVAATSRPARAAPRAADGHVLSTREQAEQWLRDKASGVVEWFDSIDPHIADGLLDGDLLSDDQKELLRQLRQEKAGTHGR